MFHEFSAHSATVTCLRIGHRHGKILATGGEDRKVNVWHIGNPTPLLSLAGHTHGISSVAIDSAEHLVIAGCTNGSLKLWDLEHAKAIRTLIGHRGTITSIEFHPLGDLFASSAHGESIVKVWDIKRNASILTLQDPSDTLASTTNIRFTPDGKFLITTGSTSARYCANVWDLSTGQIVHRFPGSSAASFICFHPRELVMATLELNGTIRVWDMEHFECISTFCNANEHATCISFSVDGKQIFVAQSSRISVYEWDPLFQLLTRLQLEIPQSAECMDMTLVQSGMQVHCVTAYRLDTYLYTARIPYPFPTNPSASNLSTSSSTHSSISGLSPLPPISTVSTTLVPLSKSASKSSMMDFDYHTKRLETTDSLSEFSTPRNNGSLTPREDFTQSFTPCNSTGDIRLTTSVPKHKHLSRSSSHLLNTSSPVVSRPSSRSNHALLPGITAIDRRLFTTSLPSIPTNDTPTSHAHDQTAFSNRESVLDTTGIHKESALSVDTITTGINGMEVKSACTQMTPQEPPTVVNTASSPLYTMPESPGGKMTDLGPRQSNPNDEQRTCNTPFGPFYARAGTKLLGIDIAALSRGSVQKLATNLKLDNVSNQHEATLSMLNTRRTLLHNALITHWDVNAVKGAIAQVNQYGTRDIWVDTLRVLIMRAPKGWTLDVCVWVLPWCSELMFEPFEDYLDVACETMMIVLKHFSPVIIQNLNPVAGIGGINVSQEERTEKCKQCQSELMQIKQLLSELSTTPGAIGVKIRSVLAAFPASW